MGTPKDQLHSTREHDQYLIVERENRLSVLEEIRTFSMDEGDSTMRSPSPPLRETRFQDSLKAKLKRVLDLLNKYEQFVALYPNYASLQKATNITEVVRMRIVLLYVWYNTTMDLYARIREVTG